MSRRKTRVTRMSRRKARSGTRKQSGGFLQYLNPANWFAKKTETNTPALEADPPTAPQGGGARKTRHRRRHHRK